MSQPMARTRDPRNDLVIKNLKKAREVAGLSTDQAAQASTVPVDNLRRYEAGKSGVPSDALRKLAATYGHKMDDFFEPTLPKPNLAARDPLRLMALPGMDVDEEFLRQAQEVINKLNATYRAKKAKK